VLPSSSLNYTRIGLPDRAKPCSFTGRAGRTKTMSEEKPTFKVTDRRLFNPDGTPREIEREEEPPTEPAGTAAATGANAAHAATTQQTGSNAAAEQQQRPSAHEPEAAPAGGDPTPFANLVMFIASPAAAALGMTEHPGLPAGEVDLPLAKHCIDLLATIQQKTHGNLSAQEQQILEGLLAELRMQYVSLSGTRPRGFTGGDITGGR
jgi:hypothetical protein